MLNLQRILGSARARIGLGVACLAGLMSLAACGQRGPLYLPTEPAAAQRATLPQIVVPALRDNAAKPEDSGARPAAPGASAPASGAGR
ncbi:MAG: lipoprotein [Proteobacteria bacterium]|nr:lipoprotein [Pseudomonadota bacterium]